MAAVLGIAAGAIKVGQKIFEGFKNRKEKKIEKKATALLEAQTKKDAAVNKFGNLFGGGAGISSPGEGTQSISASGNFLAGVKGAFKPNPNIAAFTPISGAQAVVQQNQAAAAAQSGGGINPLILLAGAVLLFFAFKK